MVNRAKALKWHKLQTTQSRNYADDPDNHESDPYNHIGDPINYINNPSEPRSTTHHLSEKIGHLNKAETVENTYSDPFSEPIKGSVKKLPLGQSKRRTKRKHKRPFKGQLCASCGGCTCPRGTFHTNKRQIKPPPRDTKEGQSLPSILDLPLRWNQPQPLILSLLSLSLIPPLRAGAGGARAGGARAGAVRTGTRGANPLNQLISTLNLLHQHNRCPILIFSGLPNEDPSQ